MTGKRRADAPHVSRPWHERTPLVVGASIAALIVVVLLYFAVSMVARNYNQPPRAPAQYIEPTNTVTTGGTTTTPSTITSTVPPQTSEIDIPTSDTSATSTTSTTTTSTKIIQSRPNHSGGDSRWPYPLSPTPHITVMPRP